MSALTESELAMGEEVDLDAFANRYNAHEHVAAFRHREQLERSQAGLLRKAHAAQLESQADRGMADQVPGRRSGHAAATQCTEGVASSNRSGRVK